MLAVVVNNTEDITYSIFFGQTKLKADLKFVFELRSMIMKNIKRGTPIDVVRRVQVSQSLRRSRQAEHRQHYRQDDFPKFLFHL